MSSSVRLGQFLRKRSVAGTNLFSQQDLVWILLVWIRTKWPQLSMPLRGVPALAASCAHHNIEMNQYPLCFFPFEACCVIEAGFFQVQCCYSTFAGQERNNCGLWWHLWTCWRCEWALNSSGLTPISLTCLVMELLFRPNTPRSQQTSLEGVI